MFRSMRFGLVLRLFGVVIGLLFAGWPGASWAAEIPTALEPTVSTYRLRASDRLQLHVYGEDDLNVTVQLDERGMATFPLIETVRLGGLTVAEATRAVREALARDYLVDPKVTLVVLERAGRTFNIIGFVRAPGPYPIVGRESISLVEAIAMAGGGTPEAKLTKVRVMRPVEGGENQIFQLDAQRMIRDPKSAGFLVLPGDTIEVPDKLF